MTKGSEQSRALDSVPYVRLLLGVALAALLAAIVLIVPALRSALLPDGATGPMIVVFGPNLSADGAFAAIHHADGLPVRRTGLGNIWIVQAAQPGFVSAIRSAGAVGVYRELPIGIVLAGCAGVIARLQPAG